MPLRDRLRPLVSSWINATSFRRDSVSLLCVRRMSSRKAAFFEYHARASGDVSSVLKGQGGSPSNASLASMDAR